MSGQRRFTQWWQYVAGASWQQPDGPGSTIDGKDNYPVVHIAHEDALAYARWRGRDLPTEAQWEFAARGGRDGEDDWSSAFDAERQADRQHLAGPLSRPEHRRTTATTAPRRSAASSRTAMGSTT